MLYNNVSYMSLKFQESFKEERIKTQKEKAYWLKKTEASRLKKITAKKNEDPPFILLPSLLLSTKEGNLTWVNAWDPWFLLLF